MTDARFTSENENNICNTTEGDWRLWGPYVSARQWGTVREDYSADGDAWSFFPFEHATSRAYRWGEDAIAGLCDSHGFLNLGVALWNGKDCRLKERYYGLTGAQGNHGEDVKEYYWPLKATPSHSYSEFLYRYPQAAFPYDDLLAENGRRGYDAPEYELADTGVLAENRFFDVVVTHAKASARDIYVDIAATNHGPEAAPLWLIPQLWFMNTWAWGRDDRTPELWLETDEGVDGSGLLQIGAKHAFLGEYVLLAETAAGAERRAYFCDNETNATRLWGEGATNRSAYPKDVVERVIVGGENPDTAANPGNIGTKVGISYHFASVAAGATVHVRLRLVVKGELSNTKTNSLTNTTLDLSQADAVFAQRSKEHDEFFADVLHDVPPAEAEVAQRAFAGLQWNKQIYRYNVKEWLEGDPAGPTPPPQRLNPQARNVEWAHLNLADVISMPDDWEYPWFASWDLAFHTVALAHVDPAFAKQQLLLMCREWAQHPDGQLPAYEWNFSDLNPPVHAWAAWQVYNIDGRRDRDFLVRILTKLLLGFGWWVNRKDALGNNLFEGGFLGMDNISLFDRSKDVPAGWTLEQSDATSWIAFQCLMLMRMSLELAREESAWAEVSVTFLERFFRICEAMESFGSGDVSLWDEQDGFFYDILTNGSTTEPIRVRSLVGLVPLLAVANSPVWIDAELPDFAAIRAWLLRHQPEVLDHVKRDAAASGADSHDVRITLSLMSDDQVRRVCERLFSTDEFLGEYGIRALSAAYREETYFDVAGHQMAIRYTPGVSENGLFGGNSNWRGPIWFPLNCLLVDALATRGAGVATTPGVTNSPSEAATFEFPAGSGQQLSLTDIANNLRDRLISLFIPSTDPADQGRRPSDPPTQPSGELWHHPTFSEYFHGDNGTGVGASHQTGWTAMVAHLICEQRDLRKRTNEKP